MNILDEQTKVMLDAGSTAVLNGGYLVMTPETFKYALETACKETLHVVFDGEVSEQDTDTEANDSFIQQGFKCRFCGKKNDATEYTMTIIGGYDSDRDTEKVTMEVCAECLERMLSAVN